jgi:PTH1 family peptidyl-tRNA hydrolase
MRMFRRPRAPAGEAGDRWLVAGLANPGSRYAGTRHNAGAMVLDVLLERSGASLKRHKSGCAIAEVGLAGTRTILARPLTYMNDSGRPLGQLARYFKVPPSRLMVVHDEIDIPFGEVRVKAGGGTAGHNGLNSVAAHLGTKDFIRVRVGVSRPRGQGDAVGHVLADFSSSERRDLPEVLERAAAAVELVLEAGIERAMTEINSRR